MQTTYVAGGREVGKFHNHAISSAWQSVVRRVCTFCITGVTKFSYTTLGVGPAMPQVRNVGPYAPTVETFVLCMTM